VDGWVVMCVLGVFQGYCGTSLSILLYKGGESCCVRVGLWVVGLVGCVAG